MRVPCAATAAATCRLPNPAFLPRTSVCPLPAFSLPTCRAAPRPALQLDPSSKLLRAEVHPRCSSTFHLRPGHIPVPSQSSPPSQPGFPSQGRVTAMSAETASASTGGAAPAIVPGVIVGGGRVGSALFRLGGERDLLVRRGETVPADSTGPILVCTRNDALDGIVDSTPEHRRQDLVFLQNGMLEPWLASRGLQDATQVLVYFAVAKMGEDPVDGVTDLNPEGLTAASGKWAEAVAARLHAAGLSCKVLSRSEFARPMLEKLIWISAFMLVGAKNGNCTVGDVEGKHRDEVEQLILELANAASLHQRKLPGSKGFAFEDGLVERLCAYARSVAHFPTAIKELQWRNGWFLGISKEAQESGQPDPCPLHTAWLKECGAIP